MSRSRRSDTLSLSEARRIALAAQFAISPRDDGVSSRADVRRLVDRLGVLQIDSVNVLTRAHTLPVFSRLGNYAREDIDHLAYAGRRRVLFEYWGHAASLMPIDMQPLFRWRMARAERGEGVYGGLARFGRERQPLIQQTLGEIRARGPVTANDFAAHANRQKGWWGWSDGKTALEWLFWAGLVTTATRRATFERVYDLTERVLPEAVLAAPTPDEATAVRALIERSARAIGIGAERCLRDYYRLSSAQSRPAIRDLVEAGTLRAVTVDGWGEVAYVHAEARRPRSVAARAVLAPFDPLVWLRDRAEALFGAHIRIELYTPKHKRTHGYYVLPFLLGERIVARVNLKADRALDTLQVLSAHAEPGFAPGEFAAPLAAEIRLMATWLGLGRVKLSSRGDAAGELRRHLGRD